MNSLKDFFPGSNIETVSSPQRFGYYEALVEKNRTIHFLIIGGTYYDKGYFYGKYLAAAFHQIIKNVLSFSKKIGLGATKEIFTKEKYLENIHAVHSRAGEHRLAELQGVVDGCREAGLPLNDDCDAALIMAFFELNEAACCSCCALNAPVSKKDTYQINTTEFPFPIACQDNPTLILFFPQDKTGARKGWARFSVGFTGLLAGLAAVNEKGVAYGSIRSSNIRDPYSSDGTPFLYLMDDAVEKASCVEEMRDVVSKHSRTNAYFVTVSDPLQTANSLNLWLLGHKVFKFYRSGEAIDLDTLQDPRYSQYTPLNNAVYWMDMPIPGIEAGPEKPCSIIQNNADLIDDTVALAMSKQMGSRYAIASSVFNTTKMHGWVAFGQKRIPSHLDHYHFIDLRELFNSYDELAQGRLDLSIFENKQDQKIIN